MRKIRAWRGTKKGEYIIPVYHDGPFWAVTLEEFCELLGGKLWHLSFWFGRFSKEYVQKGRPKEKLIPDE